MKAATPIATERNRVSNQWVVTGSSKAASNAGLVQVQRKKRASNRCRSARVSRRCAACRNGRGRIKVNDLAVSLKGRCP
jgi:hypothetical protein